MKLLVRAALVLASLALGLVLTSCGARGTTLNLAPISQLREDLQQQPTNVREAYQFALANPDTLSKLPCYCGCTAAHRNVKECFVREVNSDGTIVWDDMGASCSVCVDIVRDTMRMLQDGKQLAEIRSVVDQTYSSYGPPTNTEPIAP